MRAMRNSPISMIALGLSVAFALACSSGRSSDNKITQDIQKKIAADPETKDASVRVAANFGKVTLNGKTKTTAGQKKLEEIARGEPGVSSVEDQTVMQSSAAPVQEQAKGGAEEPNAAPAQPQAPAESQSQSQPQSQAQPQPQQQAQALEKPVVPAEKPKPQPIVIPAGTILTVRTNTSLSSDKSQAGETFFATLAHPVSVRRTTALPSRAPVRGTVVAARARGKIKGEGELMLTLNSVSVRGRTYPIQTQVVEDTLKGKGKRTAITTGGGAAGGALIGGLLGHGKGALIGGLTGAGAGFAGGALTGNKQVELPAESLLSFRLTAPLTLPPATQ